MTTIERRSTRLNCRAASSLAHQFTYDGSAMADTAARTDSNRRCHPPNRRTTSARSDHRRDSQATTRPGLTTRGSGTVTGCAAAETLRPPTRVRNYGPIEGLFCLAMKRRNILLLITNYVWGERFPLLIDETAPPVHHLALVTRGGSDTSATGRLLPLKMAQLSSSNGRFRTRRALWKRPAQN
jgi:hypothetical protein